MRRNSSGDEPMRQLWGGAACAVALAAAFGAQQPAATPAQERPLFRGGARFVRVDVYPTGPDGRPV